MRSIDKLLISDEDRYLLDMYRFSANGNGYFRTKINGREYSLHRMITLAKDGMVVDHINGNTYDNRRENLRVVSTSMNSSNAFKKAGLSVYKGVSYDKNSKRKKRWMARLQHLGRNITIGRYLVESDAAIAYNIRSNLIWGECCVLNDVISKKQVRYMDAVCLNDFKDRFGFERN